MELYGQPVIFTMDPISPEFQILHNTTAIFNQYNKQVFARNIWHFLAQIYVPFKHLIDIAANMKSTAHTEKDLFFQMPLGDQCLPRKFSSFFLGALNTNGNSRKFAYTYHSHPGNVCFRYGLFSDSLHAKYAPKALQHIKDHYNVDKKGCLSGITIIFSIRRLYRKWKNEKEIYKAVINNGFSNTRMVDFAALSLREQLEIMHCADVFVACHSAALIWAKFMKPYTSVIEIAWPKFGWDFSYQRQLAKQYIYSGLPQYHFHLEAQQITNMNFSIQMVQKYYSEEDRQRVRKMTMEDVIENYIGSCQFCDFTVDTDTFIKTLRKVVKRINK
jgi:hypothetical protein